MKSSMWAVRFALIAEILADIRYQNKTQQGYLLLLSWLLVIKCFLPSCTTTICQRIGNSFIIIVICTLTVGLVQILNLVTCWLEATNMNGIVSFGGIEYMNWNRTVVYSGSFSWYRQTPVYTPTYRLDIPSYLKSWCRSTQISVM